MSKEFEKDFTNDTEVNEALDKLIIDIANCADKEDDVPSIIRADRVALVEFIYEIAKYITKDNNDAKVSYRVHEPYKSMGSVSIISNSLVFENTTILARLIEIADNFEVYSKTDGTFQINFTFHNLTTYL